MSIGNTNQIGLPHWKFVFVSRSMQGCITVLQYYYLPIHFYSSPQVVNTEL